MAKGFEVELRVRVRAYFDDDESDAGTVRYLLEQDLEDAGWDCDVMLPEDEGHDEGL